jgi:hypothetical protein
MSNTANELSTLNGLFKETYADKLKELIPDGVKLLNKIKFMAKQKQPGNFFHQPLILGMEHGVTFAGSDEDAFNLNPPVAGQIKDASVKGSPLVMRSLLGYVSASRAAQGGAQAFEDATKFLVANMLRSMAKKLEIQMLYGQKSYGAISAVSGATLTIKTSEWAPGIWAGAENMPIEIRTYQAAGDTPSSSSSVAEAVVKSVDLNARTIILQAAVSGITTTANQEDVIFHKGAFGNEFPGIHKIISQSTGSLFGINVADYNMYRGNTYDAGSANLSFAKLNQALTRAVEKGLDGKVLVICNPRTWASMLNNELTLRQYDQSYSSAKLENGSKSLKFFSQNGEMEIEPSIYVKEGYCYILSLEDWTRIGSSDVSFKRPGKNDEFFRDLENSAAYELRLFTDQCIFTSSVGRNVLVHGIVNS